MMTYEQAVAYIHSVAWQGSRPGLSRIRELTERLGHPERSLRFIHIAGTNGKGSVSAMTEAILRAAGYRTGLFVSPYIKHFTERIQLCGEPITERALAEATEEVKACADEMTDAPTEFELITAIGLVYFKKERCDVVVLETGMGGRLDSTNIIEHPLLTVITGIALDHTAFLGNTVEAIAGEKAGILKPGAPAVFGGYDAVARQVIGARAEALGVPFRCAADTPLTVHEMTLAGTRISYGTHADLTLSLLGAYQPQNAATVLTGIDLLREGGLSIDEEAVRRGMATVRWPGRFELLSREPLILSDGAHNPEGIAAAARSLALYFGKTRVLLLCGVMSDKDHSSMVSTLAPHAAEVFTLRPNNPRALSAESFAEEFREAGIPATAYPTPRAATEAAVLRARETKTPLVALGSLYMYEEVTTVLEDMNVIEKK